MPGMTQAKCTMCNGSFYSSAEDPMAITEHYCACPLGPKLKAEDQRRSKGQKSAKNPTAWARLTSDKDPF
jgi:hypothetical protein